MSISPADLTPSEPDDEVAKLQAEEIRRRLAEYRAGTAKMLSADEVFKRWRAVTQG
jgi:hypothetical protein